MTEVADKPPTDWVSIEKHYRAGIKSLRAIADDYGVTEGAIRKRAKRDQWTRNLEERIQQRAQEKVRKELVRTPGTQLTPASERRTVEQYSDIVASVDLVQRDDVKLAMSNARGLLEELVELSRPEFRLMLEQLADEMDQSTPARQDKTNELYRYIISISGRVKMAKELAAVHGVYVPLQRKIYKLDDDSNNKTSVDELLEMIAR